MEQWHATRKSADKMDYRAGITASTLRSTGLGMTKGRHPSSDIYRIYEWTQRSGAKRETKALARL